MLQQQQLSNAHGIIVAHKSLHPPSLKSIGAGALSIKKHLVVCSHGWGHRVQQRQQSSCCVQPEYWRRRVQRSLLFFPKLQIHHSLQKPCRPLVHRQKRRHKEGMRKKERQEAVMNSLMKHCQRVRVTCLWATPAARDSSTCSTRRLRRRRGPPPPPPPPLTPPPPPHSCFGSMEALAAPAWSAASTNWVLGELLKRDASNLIRAPGIAGLILHHHHPSCSFESFFLTTQQVSFKHSWSLSMEGRRVILFLWPPCDQYHSKLCSCLQCTVVVVGCVCFFWWREFAAPSILS